MKRSISNGALTGVASIKKTGRVKKDAINPAFRKEVYEPVKYLRRCNADSEDELGSYSCSMSFR